MNETISDPDSDDARSGEELTALPHQKIRRGVLERLFGESGQPEQPVQFGRYQLRRCLGSGGMGTVLLAYDPDLEREVAVKVLHAELSRRSRARLFEEAKTMARLTHPNVVGIYDIGEQDDQIFLAMERIDGGTLREWSEGHERSWREIVEVYCAAARGLYAAHQAGIVHRDFKPDNVLVSADGDVKVTDFGIAMKVDSLRARIAASIAPTQPGDDESDESAVAPRPALGSLGGTPAYMAPEYIRGDSGDERSDQFSFFISLYETLCGERPFDANDILSLFTKIFVGERSPRPVLRQSVPKALWAIIDRGLNVDPSQRFGSMKEVEEALARTLESRWRRMLIPLMAVAVVASGIGGAAMHREVTHGDCEDEAAQIDQLWGREGRAQVRDGMLGTALPYAERSWEQVDEHVSTWVEDWTRGRVAACMDRAQDVHASRRVQCFDAQQDELSGLLWVLAEPDAATVEHAVRSLTALPDPSRCADDDWLLAGIPVPVAPESRQQVREASQTLSRARALIGAARLDEADALVAAPLELATALDYPPLLSSAHLTMAKLHEGRGEYERARTLLIDAMATAHRVDAPLHAARAGVALIHLEGGRQERVERGLTWARLVEGTLERLGDGATSLQIDRELYLSQLERLSGRSEQALARAQAVLSRTIDRYGSHDIRVPALTHAVAAAHSHLGHHDEGITLMRRAIELEEQLLGPEHPAIANSLGSLAVTLVQQGRGEEAEQAIEQSVELARRSVGAEHPRLAGLLNNQANIAIVMRKLDVAAPLLEESLQIKVRTLGPEHPSIARTRMNLGTLERRRGRSVAALDYYRQATEEVARSLGTDDPFYAEGLGNVASVLSDLERYSEAKEYLEHALELVSESDADYGELWYFLADVEYNLGELELAAEHAAAAQVRLTSESGATSMRTGRAMVLHGTVLLELDRIPEAEPLLTQGRDILASEQPGSIVAAEAWFALARLRSVQGDRREAVVLATRAREEASADPMGTEYATMISAWLDEHQ